MIFILEAKIGFLDLFVESDDKRAKRLEEKNKEKLFREEREYIENKLSKVRFFPGTQSEYELFVGYPVKIIGTENRNIGVIFSKMKDSSWECNLNFKCKKTLVENGIEAIVNCNYSLGGNDLVFYKLIYGLPVAKL